MIFSPIPSGERVNQNPPTALMFNVHSVLNVHEHWQTVCVNVANIEPSGR